jgi:hypothetical protein
MEEAFEEGQGPHRAVEPVMMMMMMMMSRSILYPVKALSIRIFLRLHSFDLLFC